MSFFVRLSNISTDFQEEFPDTCHEPELIHIFRCRLKLWNEFQRTCTLLQMNHRWLCTAYRNMYEKLCRSWLKNVVNLYTFRSIYKAVATISIMLSGLLTFSSINNTIFSQCKANLGDQ